MNNNSVYAPENPPFQEWSPLPVLYALKDIEKSTFHDENTFQLKQVQIFHRHGARTPAVPTPSWFKWQDFCKCASPFPDPSEKECFQSQEYGELTTVGRNQMRNLGKTARSFYFKKLNLNEDSFQNSNLVYISATPIPRVKESLKHFFAEFFPKVKEKKFENFFDFFLDIRQDLYIDKENCPRLRQLEEEFKNRSDYLKYKEKFKEALQKELSQYFPSNSNHLILQPIFLYDIIEIQRQHTKPNNLDPISFSFFRKLSESNLKSWFSQYSEKESAKLAIGRMIKTSFENLKTFKDNNEKKEKKKFLMFSGHDTTLGPFLSGLGLLHFWPPIASVLFLELWEKSNKSEKETKNEKEKGEDMWVRMVYNDQVIRIPECQDQSIEDGKLCPLDRYLEILSPLVPKNFVQECQLKPISSKSL